LWPLSRKSYPKQFAPLLNDQSLFQTTALRFSGASYAAPMIVTNSDFRFIVTEQLAAVGLDPSAILIEPDRRNTAPAVLAAALYLSEQHPQALMLVSPSDHDIPDAAAFQAAVDLACAPALDGQLVTFGMTPDRPETGYGYLELDGPDTGGAVPLKSFVEKPDLVTAQAMLAQGGYLWNSGIFLFSVATILQAFRTHAPELVETVTAAVSQAKPDLGFLRLAPDPWSETEDISIDYAVMERSDNLTVVPYHGAWSDLGSWDAVWRATQADAEGTAVTGLSTSIDCTNTLLRAESDRQVVVGIGLDNIVAIAMPDAVLIADKSRAQDVSKAVSALKASKALQAEAFPRDHRPWGWFESLVIGQRFQVKRIVVHPGAALSLQSHHHRAEHWIVVEGTARVTIDETAKLISENQSVYIPLGATHRLENPGKVPMVLIEVQTGSYLGEDDIIRYQDVYARE
jgi:mannose-1-phosphate guanylyltransferase/mannose-6-phosphate isomerase